MANDPDGLRRYAAIGLLGRTFTHEFNNVLGGILGSAQLLAMKEDDPQRAERLATIVQAVQRGMALTLAFAGAASACDGGAADLHAVVAELSRRQVLAPAAPSALVASRTAVRMDAGVLAEVVAALAGAVAVSGEAAASTRDGESASGHWIELRLEGTTRISDAARAIIDEPLRVGTNLQELPLAGAAAVVRMARGRIVAGDDAAVTLALPLGEDGAHGTANGACPRPVRSYPADARLA